MKVDFLKDIRFWIFIFFIVRLFGISNPPLEVGHNWRQTTVTMVARNFYEYDNNIFYPRIDIAGDKSGITGMEFPILNYICYIFSEFFGYQHWYGRLINLLVSSLGLWFFYRLLLKYFSNQIAFYATIILAVSIWFQFSRKIMPDTFSMSFIISSLYYGSNYLENYGSRSYFYLFIYFVCLITGVLSKLPSIYLIVFFGILFLNKKIPHLKKFVFALVSIIALIPVAIWYFYWVPFLVEKYEFWHFFMGKSIEQGFFEIIQNFNKTLSRFYDDALKYIGFAVFIFGLIISVFKKEWKIYFIFLLSLLSFLIIVFKAGLTFYHHNYYVIPFVPVMSLVAGYGLSKIKYKNLAVILLIAISIEGISNQQHDFFLKEKNLKLLNLELDLNSFSDKNDLILINSGNYPTPMYFSHRKGWVESNEKIKDKEFIFQLKSRGLKFVVILKKVFGKDIKLEGYKILKNNDDYCIYKI